MKYKLSVKPKGSSRSGFEYGTGPLTTWYEVRGLPEGKTISIVRAAYPEPVWQIHGDTTKRTDAFKTAEEALSQLQMEIDSADEEIRSVGQ
jgi:hypothetical protein